MKSQKLIPAKSSESQNRKILYSQITVTIRYTRTTSSTHIQCSRGNRTPPLLVCESHDVHSKAIISFQISGFRTYLAIVTGGFCPCMAIVLVSAAVFHLRMLHCTGLGVRSQRSKIGPKISQISRYIRQISWRFEIDRPKGLKEARRCRLVGSKASFPFRSSASEVGAKWPVAADTRHHRC